MKFLFFSILSVISISFINAQKIVYFNADWVVVKNEAQATYYRQLNSSEKGLTRVDDFKMDKTPVATGKTPNAKRALTSKKYYNEGAYVTYNQEGKVSSVLNYKEDKLHGNCVYYYDDGQLKSHVSYVDGKETVYVSFYPNGVMEDSVATSHVDFVNTKRVVSYYPNGKLLRDDVYDVNKKLVAGICYDSLGVQIPHYYYEVMPEFYGGNKALNAFIGRNLRYPVEAQKGGLEGKVYVGFAVDVDGQVVDIKVVRGVHHHLDREAKRVVAAMPYWQPGKRNGKPVRVSYTVPINFMLLGRF